MSENEEPQDEPDDPGEAKLLPPREVMSVLTPADKLGGLPTIDPALTPPPEANGPDAQP